MNCDKTVEVKGVSKHVIFLRIRIFLLNFNDAIVMS